MTDTDRLNTVLTAIDDRNAEDPVSEWDAVHDVEMPRALLYGRRMSERLGHYCPNADELLRIAVRGQHIRRWRIARAEFPAGRGGYLQWRRQLGAYHAEQVAVLMEAAAYPATDQACVAAMLRKEGIKRDSRVQTLEDVAAQVFLLHYLRPFLADQGERHGKTKLQGILARTWRKMSPAGRAAAIELPLAADVRPILEAALEGRDQQSTAM